MPFKNYASLPKTDSAIKVAELRAEKQQQKQLVISFTSIAVQSCIYRNQSPESLSFLSPTPAAIQAREVRRHPEVEATKSELCGLPSQDHQSHKRRVSCCCQGNVLPNECKGTGHFVAQYDRMHSSCMCQSICLLITSHKSSSCKKILICFFTFLFWLFMKGLCFHTFHLLCGSMCAKKNITAPSLVCIFTRK